MKKLIVFFFSISVFAQDYGNNAETLKLCTTLQTNSFSSNLDADTALDRILEVVGLSKNFVLAPCSDINNALAVSFKGVRYILYDPEFMSMLSSDTSNWTNLFILAHEVGHHVNGHSLDLVLYAGEIVDAPELKKKREQELEADEFAGFILAKLGASLIQTTLSVSKLSNEDDTYSTHPKRDKRISAIKIGYENGIKNNLINTELTKASIFTPRDAKLTSNQNFKSERIFKLDEVISNLTEDKKIELFNDPFLLEDYKLKYPEEIRKTVFFGNSFNQNASKDLALVVTEIFKDLEDVNPNRLKPKDTSYVVHINLVNFDEMPLWTKELMIGAAKYLSVLFDYRIDENFQGILPTGNLEGWQKVSENLFYEYFDSIKLKKSIKTKEFYGDLVIDDYDGSVFKLDSFKSSLRPSSISIIFDANIHTHNKIATDFLNKLRNGEKLFIRYSKVDEISPEDKWFSSQLLDLFRNPIKEKYTYYFDLTNF